MQSKRGEKKLTPGSRSPEYRIWTHIKRRCHRKQDPAFKKYGAKGISVCAEWRESFAAFYNWMGPRPSPDHSVDRIDPRGNYEPGNVRWADHFTQANNRTNNVLVSYRGKQMTFAEAWRSAGMRVTKQSAWNRFNRFGWTLEDSVEKAPSAGAVRAGDAYRRSLENQE